MGVGEEISRSAAMSNSIAPHNHVSKSDNVAEAGAYLDWTQSAEVLSAMVGGWDCGKVNRNPQAPPNMTLKSDSVRVNQLQRLEQRSGAAPGTLITIASEGWCITTGSDDVLISSLETLEGNPVDPGALAEQVGLQPGKQLPKLRSEQTREIREALDALAAYEQFWHKRLELMQPIQLPYEIVQKQNAPRWVTASWCKPIPCHCAKSLRLTTLGAFVIYLARLTGQSRLQIGWRLVPKSDKSTLPTIFASTVPMECEIEWNSPFASIIDRIEEEVRLLDQNRTYPRDLIYRSPALRAISELKTATPWRIAVSMIDNPADEEVIGALLTLQIDSQGRFRWIYDTHRLEMNVIERMSDHLRELAQAAAAESGMPVAQLNLLPEAERKLLVETWNDTKTSYANEACIHQLIEQQVARTPDATAVFFEDELLSYAQLNARANQLAHQLIELNVKPDALVAICVKRSPAMIVALLAVLKAGAAYVPLDPSHQSTRLTYILADVNPDIVFADETGCLALGKSALNSRRVLDPNVPAHRSEVNPTVDELTSRHLAYVIYTSGSTGKPKGVMLEHRGLVNLIQDHIARFEICDASRILQFSSFCWDVSVREIFMALGSGASLYLLSDIVRRDPNSLSDYLQHHAITHVNLPPVLLKAWRDELRLNNSVTIIVSGEAPDAALLQELVSRNITYNTYGGTEITDTATVWRCPTDFAGKTVSIGRPIANTRIYLLDTHRQPVPLGALGELHIGGDGVARGYLNPELTAERFFPDPFAGDPDARMYKTGDLARYLSDGNLVYVGRNDHQFKIRGFRIEPGEIEARLIEYPSVREAAVVPMGESDKRIIAYVVADEIKPASLREHLLTHLPDYMIPSAIVRLDALPLTPNGKLDRRALPAPDANALDHALYEAPVGSTEIALAEIWRTLLNVSRISRHDSFFALGGHSLLAVRLKSRIASLGVELPLSTLYASPTLKALATAIQTQMDAGAVVRPPITAVARDGGLPLSFAQQRLWFLAQLDGVSSAYHIQFALHMKGLLNVCVLQQVLDTLWARHEALRTVFINVNGQPEVRLLDPEQGLSLRRIDLEEESQLTALCVKEAQSPFDLTSGPLIRALLIRFRNDEHMCLLTQHHIVSDGWSFNVLLHELSEVYRAYLNKEPNPLPLLTIQYPDYAAWQREWLAGERLQKQHDYWKTTLLDLPVRLDLPTDRPRPIRQSFAGDCVPIELDRELTECLMRMSQQHDVTLFMTLLAAWAAVLSRLSGQNDIVIGAPSANRGQPEIEPLIGFFVNTLAMRVNLSGHPSVAELLARVRKIVLEAQDHQDLPFEQVVEIVQPSRRLDHTPVFQVMFTWQTDEKRSYTWPGLDVSSIECTHDVAMFDLELNLTEINDHIVGELRFATALFNKNTIERHVNYVKTLLKAMAVNADRPIDRMDILDSAERELLLEKWNDTRTPYPDQACIHQLFEQQVARTPDATAIFFEDDLLSYAQLNARANQLAHRLIELNVKPEALVAICVKRSPAMIVALLAVLKAGAAYVPLDPSHRGTRLTHILSDVDPEIVLADETGLLALGKSALNSRRVLDPNMPTRSFEVNPTIPRLTSRHLSHVIYTSGSTGIPKGVMIKHQGLVNMVQDQIACFEVGVDSRILQFASFCWDVSITEIFMALGSGASLYLISDIVRKDLNGLFDYLQHHAITHINLPPALLQAWGNKFRLNKSLKIILEGETPDAALLQDLVRRNITYNAYGLTESTDVVAVWRCPAGYTGNTVPIGRPISNTRFYLLDIYNQPVPLGAVGELYIGGVGVACGYLNRPDLTAERFLSDPYAGDPDARMYKTGDLARYLSDGNLEFLGRNDHQFKIRGFRIEPGEIEARLVDYPSVREAVVVALGEPNKRLIAYVVADEIEPASLREHLLTHLPDYMIPSAIVKLDALPLTPNGKLDRCALPAPDANVLTHAPYEAPVGVTEIALAEIWRALLGVSQISRHDSFFALGGHSLLAMRLHSQIASLGAELPLATLYESPSLKALAMAIQTQLDAGPVVRPPITAVARDGGLPLSFAQQRLWFLAQLDGVSSAYHIPLTLRLRGPLNVSVLQRVLDTLWTRHESMRMVFVNVNGEPEVRLLDPERGLPLRLIELEEVTQLTARCAEEIEYPFDMTSGPLTRALLIQLRYDEHVFLLTQHHIVSDGWSLDVLLRELSAVYCAYLNQKPNPLPPLTIQYLDYAAWQREWPTGERLQKQQDYWKTTLLNLPVRLDLPTDRPRPIRQSFAGDCVPFELDPELTIYLKRLSQQHDVTLFMTLLAAWGAVLSRLSGQEDIVIGCPSANRRQPEIESLIGFFVNTLAMRVNLSGHPSVNELLARVKKIVVEAQDHQDLPFEQVVEIVQPSRCLDHTPVFQVMFAWQTDEKRSYTWPGLDVSPIECTYDVAKFDLELNLTEINDHIVGELGFATALFNKNTIERHVNYLKTLLKAMVVNADHPIGRIDILDSAERKLLMEKWNDTRTPFSDQACIHQLFEQQVSRTPNAIAIFFENDVLSYAQLNTWANQLAHRLIELDVKPDELVVICVKRSPAMIVGLLAVLKAGAAYVPLDPSHRGTRLTHIFANVDPKIVLADETGLLALGESTLNSRRVLDPNTPGCCFEVNPTIPRLTSRHLAHVIFTSGSTGTPKGVMIEHRGLVNLIQDQIARLAVGAASRILQFASFCWDVSITEIFMALGSGASLYLLSDIVRKDPNSLFDYLQHHAITHITLPPALLQAWRDEFRLNESVTIILGGEAPDAALLQQLAKRNIVYNSYGPTEITDVAAVWRCPAGYTGKTVPIGRPISNTRFYLLDDYNQPVPLGAVGELYIGGNGVARGYLNPVLAAERFFPDPFAGDPDAQMYKTGDLARYLSDGNLEFLGRNDHQFKIRGFRIEPGEIEARLVEYPSVREAVVLMLGEPDKRLIAYVVADEIEPASLREHLLTHLPDYMIPSAIVRLDALPLTPNNKLDRRALPAPDKSALTHAPYEAPVGSTEIALAEIWRALLGVSEISRHDSFFALGGHSLLAVRLISRIASLGVELPLATLYASPTLKALAIAIQTQLDAGAVVRPPITAVARDSDLPLSFAQQRLWFLAQLDGVSSAYHIPFALHLKGSSNVCVLQRVLDTLWARHEALRTVFINVNGQPKVRLLDHDQGLSLRRIDLEEESQLAALCIKEAQSPFDLTNGPLIRALLIRLRDDEHMFLLTQHHIVSDGWSFNVLLHELSAMYRAYLNKEPNPLPPLTIQYPDYAAWQREWLTGERLQKQHDYWKTTLLDLPVRLDLPTDRPRPIQQSFAGDCVPIELDRELTVHLRRLSQQHDVTLFTTLLAAWAAVLSRLSGQNDIVIGSPSANRGQPEIEPLIGFFVNTLALRVNLSGQPSVAELLARVNEIAVQAQDHQDLPFEQVVEIVQPPRRLDHTPVFQVMFAWQNNQNTSWAFPGLDVSQPETSYDAAKFDLELNLAEINDRITGELGFATALFNKNTIERHVNYLKTLLKAMTTDANYPIERIDILDLSERELLLEKWNDTQMPYPDQACIHQLFEQQVAQTPDATAISFKDELLSYAQLNARANRLAYRLVELDVAPGNYVAILLERSISLVIAQLAILKAGAAYVPLDPTAPPDRHSWILDDSSARLLITDVQNRTFSIPVLRPDEIDLKGTTLPNPDLPGSSLDIAYVMYTSGSTGIPKGVLVPHRGIVRSVVNNGFAEIGPNDRVAFTANPAFDASTFEVWGPLANGGTLVVVDRESVINPHVFCETLRKKRINILLLSTGLFNQFVALLDNGFPRLDTLIVGGDTLDPCLVRAVLANNPPKRLINAYGVTESTIFATTYTICEIANEHGSVPIGRPIANTTIYLLDAYGQPVPQGTVGEMYIGGVGIACGYLNRPDLTVERFLPDPFQNDPEARMYKSGDLAHYLPDGNLVFLGRNDYQVKIRGFRIEPSEIEARLAKHPAVRQSVVTTFGVSDKRLIAYVVVSEKVSACDLREYLTHRLPDYMMPAAFVQLETLPLTLNGKIDRQALPPPNTDAFVHASYEAPVGPIETALADMWKSLLDVSQVSRYDSFFALGGHSLLAVQLNSRIASLGAELPFSTLYASPTLKALAMAIQAQLDAGAVVRPPITAVARDGGLPLSFAQQRLWFLAQLNGVSSAYHIPFALHLKGTLNVCVWQQVLDTLWARHEALRTVFMNVNGQPEVHLLDPELGLSLRRIDLEKLSQLAALCAEEVQTSFDLTSGPLIRALLIRLRNDEHMFLLTKHHIVSDGWSFNVLLHEFSAVYRAYLNQEPNPLPPLTIQYPDYAAWQREWLTGERLQNQRDYWRTALLDLPMRLDLPTDRPRPIRQSFAGDCVPIELDPELTAYLKRLSQQHDVTLFMTLLAAWAAVLSRLSGQDDIVIGSPSANRRQPEIESLIGFFVNTLALRVNLSGQPSVAELLTRVKKIAVQAQDHQDLPFEQVVEIVQPSRRLDHTPVFQVMFAWQNNQNTSWVFPGLDVSQAETFYDAAKFDLELSLAEINDQIVGELGFATALFNKNTIERHVNYLKTLLKAMVANADSPIYEIDILDSTERKLLLEDRNDTKTLYSDQACIHQLFEQQVARTPNATAIFFENEVLSYAQLNTRANQLAHRLIELDVKPDELVVICVKRSPAMIVGLLAVLKAGAAYVPLEPTHQSTRLTHILAEVDPSIVLADETGCLALGKSALNSRHVLDPNMPTRSSEVNPTIPRLTSRHLSHVIYTSGSTGIPKGVMLEHRGLVNLIQDHIARFEICDASRVLQFSSFCWDVSIREIFMALGSGASLYLLSDIIRRDPHSLFNYLQHHGITHVNLPPVLLQAWRGEFRLKNSLTIIVGGEAPDATLLQELAERNIAYNSFGGTEITDVAAVWRCPAGYTGKTVPIGCPISNTRIYLLDAHRQPVPRGALGEIYIGGVGVARGYLNPKLTAERFFPDPFAGDPDARMYKSGDLARYVSDGNLVFFGRNDHQVKIRGFRIEPSEIEARLMEYPSVREAVVVTLGEPDKRLIAYVVADEIRPASLREHLLTHLPEYMIPSAIVRLDAFPLTSNGKLDRRALPAPDTKALTHAPYEAPVGSTEIALAEIWRALLGVSQISRHDSFFALGGHSLLAVRLNSRIASLGAELPLVTLYASPTLKALAKATQTQRDAGAVVRPLISAVVRNDGLRPSFGQQRLWFLAQLNGANNAYNVPFALHLKGSLNVCVLQRVLDTIWARHEALRTVFINVDGQPEVRLLDPEQGLFLRRIDLEEPSQLEALCAEEAQSSFDLTSGPLIRALLIRVRDDEHMLLLTQHHIVTDGWSHGVLIRELNALYCAYQNQEPNPLPPLLIQYPDYAAWQHSWLTGKRLEEQRDYWRTTMLNAQVWLDLPTDRPRPIHQSFVGDFVPIELDRELTLCLKHLCQEYDVTLYMIILAAWAAVLSRLSGQDEIIIGSPSANRGQPEIEPLIGFFVNMLAMRVNLSGQLSVAELLTRVKKIAVQAQDHQDLPFEQVVEIIQPSRRLDRNPVFQVMFAWQNNENPHWSCPGLDVRQVILDHLSVKFDLVLDLAETNDQIVGELLFPTALFDKNTIERQASYLKKLLKVIAANADHSIDRIDILDSAERELLLEKWNNTQMPYPDHACIHQLFEQQAARTPDATAIFFEDQLLSYAQLNARANQLAHRLIELDVKPDELVVICVKRSLAMIVGLLAVWKAGVAYVPLDPTHRSTRLTHIFADVDPAIVLADETGRLALGGAALASRHVLDPNIPAHRSEVNPKVASLTSRHLAYVIYTSGSTGIPKGVMVEHQGLVNLAEDQIARFEVRPTSRILQFSDFCWDASVNEIVMALVSGASLYVLSDIVRQDPNNVFDYLQQHAITHIIFPPVLLQAWRDTFRPINGLTIILGGEAPNAALLQELLGQNTIFNCYGPTESTVCAAVWRCPAGYTGKTVPIGRPISNTRIYLLDTHGQPVPLGASGELYIVGDGVARGYLNRPDLTSERFLPDPFGRDPNARMYKTGDLARYLPNGDLLFLGRNDHQVKIRGFRVEPGEVEAKLAEHPAVRETVVVAFGEPDKRLVAYVVADEIEPVALREHLRTHLPEYMLPTVFMRLDAFPVMPNGKLDRQALPVPDTDALAHAAYEAPIGAIETTLAEIWREVLGVDQVCRHDSFFTLGGHSLLAVKMIHRARSCGLPCSLNELFEHPLLASLAARMASASLSTGHTKAVPVRPTGSEQPVFFVPSGLGDHSYVFSLARHIHEKYPVYALPWPAMGESFRSTIEAWTEIMIALIKAIQPKGPYRIAGYSAGGILAYSMAESLSRGDNTLAFVGLIDTPPPQLIRDLSSQDLFFEYLAQNTSAGNMKNIVDLSKTIDNIDHLNLIRNAHQLGLLDTNLSPEFFVSAWERINLFSQAASSYEPQPLPLTIHQFHPTEKYSSRSWVDDSNKSQSQHDISSEWKYVLPDKSFRFIPIPGDHWTMISDIQNRSHLGEALSRELETFSVDPEVPSPNPKKISRDGNLVG